MFWSFTEHDVSREKLKVEANVREAKKLNAKMNTFVEEIQVPFHFSTLLISLRQWNL